MKSSSEQLQVPERRSIDQSKAYQKPQPDPYGEALGYEDVFTQLEHAMQHYDAVGLGKDHVRRIVR